MTFGPQKYLHSLTPNQHPNNRKLNGIPGTNKSCVTGDTVSDVHRFHRMVAIIPAIHRAAIGNTHLHHRFCVFLLTMYSITNPTIIGKRHSNPSKTGTAIPPYMCAFCSITFPPCIRKVFPISKPCNFSGSQQVIKICPP